MKKRKIKLFTIALLVAMMAFACTVSATTGGITVNVTAPKASVNYVYGRPGAVLRAKGDYVEEHTSTHQTYVHYFENYSTGSNTSAFAYKNADLGYNFIKVKGSGYYNGILDLETSYYYA